MRAKFNIRFGLDFRGQLNLIASPDRLCRRMMAVTESIVRELVIEGYFRDARISCIIVGTSESRCTVITGAIAKGDRASFDPI